jgi:hypothetical protein
MDSLREAWFKSQFRHVDERLDSLAGHIASLIDTLKEIPLSNQRLDTLTTDLGQLTVRLDALLARDAARDAAMEQLKADLAVQVAKATTAMEQLSAAQNDVSALTAAKAELEAGFDAAIATAEAAVAKLPPVPVAVDPVLGGGEGVAVGEPTGSTSNDGSTAGSADSSASADTGPSDGTTTTESAVQGDALSADQPGDGATVTEEVKDGADAGDGPK